MELDFNFYERKLRVLVRQVARGILSKKTGAGLHFHIHDMVKYMLNLMVTINFAAFNTIRYQSSTYDVVDNMQQKEQ